jgi:hypothetical protein
VPRWSPLSTASVEQVTEAMTGAGLSQVNQASQAGALDALPFYVVEWTFSFVTVLGGVLGVVAVLALLVAVEVGRRQNALGGALVLRMGMRSLFGRHLIELGALAGLATLAGVACCVMVADLAVPGSIPRAGSRPARRCLIRPRSSSPWSPPGAGGAGDGVACGALGAHRLDVGVAPWLRSSHSPGSAWTTAHLPAP